MKLSPDDEARVIEAARENCRQRGCICGSKAELEIIVQGTA
jgi:hypothetical protein